MDAKSFFGLRHASVLTLGACLGLVGCSVDASSNTDAPNGAESHSSALTTQKLCGYDKVEVLGKKFVVQNNLWNKGTHCIDVDLDTGDFVLSEMDDMGGGLTGYPSIYKGCHYGDCTNDSGMPRKVSELKSVRGNWQVGRPDHGMYNAAYDIWLNTKPESPGQNDGAEIMVWTYNSGYPHPVGALLETASINGEDWDVWAGPLQNKDNGIIWNVITYVRRSQEDIRPASFDELKSFIDDSQRRSLASGDWFLTSVQAGFEPRHDAAGLSSKGFDVTVE